LSAGDFEKKKKKKKQRQGPKALDGPGKVDYFKIG